MSRLNIEQLVATASQNIQVANEVGHDPAVVKAAKQFAGDSAQAFRSGKELAREAQSSWRRHSPLIKGTEASA